MHFDGKLRHLGRAHIAELQALLPKISEGVWLQNPFRQTTYEVHRQTRSLIFRQVRGDHPADSYDLPIFRAWQGMLSPILTQIGDCYGPGRFSRIMLANLPAGCAIPPHRDHGDAYALTHRVHVPVQTSPDVAFYIDGEDHFLECGEIYEINNLLDHGVTNAGADDRIHLIADYLENTLASETGASG